MTQVVLEFPLPDTAAEVYKDVLYVDLGNSCTLIVAVPTWVKRVVGSKLKLELEIEGSPDGDAR